MKEFIEKLIGRLEEYKKQWMDADYLDGIDELIEIVNELAEEYNNGWIPVTERLPDEPEESLQDIRYFPEYIVTINGADESTTLYYMGDAEWSDADWNAYDVIAWQPLPAPYKEEGETDD